jgi:hypothetical protein
MGGSTACSNNSFRISKHIKRLELPLLRELLGHDYWLMFWRKAGWAHGWTLLGCSQLNFLVTSPRSRNVNNPIILMTDWLTDLIAFWRLVNARDVTEINDVAGEQRTTSTKMSFSWVNIILVHPWVEVTWILYGRAPNLGRKQKERVKLDTHSWMWNREFLFVASAATSWNMPTALSPGIHLKLYACGSSPGNLNGVPKL